MLGKLLMPQCSKYQHDFPLALSQFDLGFHIGASAQASESKLVARIRALKLRKAHQSPADPRFEQVS